MKCIKSKEGEIVRATEKDAVKFVKTGKWSYCPKSEWKQKVRDVKVKVEVKREDVIKELANELKPKKVKKPKRSRRNDK